MAEESKIQITLSLNADNASATLRNFKGDIIASKIPLSEVRKEFGNFVLSAKETQRTITTTRTSFDNLGKSIGGFRTASGSAASSALELGRIVSDMPYGIRGVANNMSQFASQMMFSATTVDQATGKIIGLSGAVKNLWASLLGPLGVLLAIQAVIAAFDHFEGGSKKAGKALGDFSGLVGTSAAKLMLLKSLTEKSNISLKDKQKIVGEVNKEFKDLNLSLDKQGKLTKTSQDNLDALTDSLIKNAKAQAVLKKVTESQSKIVEIEIERAKRISEAGVGAFDGTLETLEKKRTEYIDRFKKQIGVDGKATIDQQKLIDDYIKSSYITKFDDLKNFKASEIKLEEDKIKKLEELISKEGLFSLFDDKGKNAKKAIAYILDVFPSIDKDKFAKMTDSELLDLKRHLEMVSKKKPLKLITELDLSFFESQKNKKKTDEKLKKIFEDKMKLFQDYADMAKKVLGSVTSFLEAEYERELTIEQNKTNALNNELNQRLLNENLSKSERAKIQNEIAKNDEALRKKQEAIEKKRFEMNKAANIAGATIDTFRAAAGVLASTEGGSFARIAGMIAVIGAGLAQVTAISRQQFQSSAGSATPIRGLGSSGGEGDRSFNYNLVGNNQANQIAEALQGQFSNPLKAYVVSREVTTQQELDMNIKSGASF